jgi:EpsI family protein
MIKWLAAIAFLSLNTYIYYFMANEAVIPPRDTFTSFPLQVGEWRCPKNEPLPSDVLQNLGATDTLVCEYHRDGDPFPLGLYIGYHATQVREEGGGSNENSIHPPAHCLPGSGWDIIDSRTVPLALPGIGDPNARAKRLVIAKGTARQLVYYWYQMQGRSVAEDWEKVLFVGYDRARGGRTDGALVRFTLPFERDPSDAVDAELLAFAKQITPLLTRYVPN